MGIKFKEKEQKEKDKCIAKTADKAERKGKYIGKNNSRKTAEGNKQ